MRVPRKRRALFLREPGRRPGEPHATRVNRRSGHPDRRKISKIVSVGAPVQPASPAARLHGLSGGLLQEQLRLALQLKPRVLMRLAAGQRGNPLHEIKYALRRVAFLAQDGLDYLRHLGL